MLLFSLKILGWLTAHTPEPILRALAAALGDFVFFALPRRRRLVLSNLHHAFPEKPAAWHRSVGRESCRRLIETALLSLATPYLSESHLRAIVSASPGLLAVYAEHARDPAPTLICSPHIAYWETQTAKPLVVPGPFPEFGIIFRPLDHPAANAFVQRSRERFGMKLLSRKEGFAEALKILRRRGFVGVLFDQNAGLQGALTTLFGRVCSTTELPGLMAAKFNARVYGIFPRRLAFWRIEIGAEQIAHDGSSEAVTLGLNRWLERLLSSDENLCRSWLWAHDRWRNQDMPARRLRLEAKRNLLGRTRDGEERENARHSLPRSSASSPSSKSSATRIWIRLPNWLGDVVMSVPLLHAIRASRPDAELTLVAKRQFLPLLEHFAVADRLHALPARDGGYFAHFRALRGGYADTWVLFTNSFRGDCEAWLTGCRQRFGVARAGRPRPLLSHAYHLPADYDERTHHQVELWEDFLRHFGLDAPIELKPVAAQSGTPDSELQTPNCSPIGLIPGSENNPEKRWPVEHWRALIEAFPHETFHLFGTAGDAAITSSVAAAFAPERVRDFAGKTDLVGFAHALLDCRVLVSNDTGGMHLANALGVPLIALFGPTNPVRTGPIFMAPKRILQAPGCAPTGGISLALLRPEMVIAAVREMTAEGRGRTAAQTI